VGGQASEVGDFAPLAPALAMVLPRPLGFTPVCPSHPKSATAAIGLDNRLKVTLLFLYIHRDAAQSL